MNRRAFQFFHREAGYVVGECAIGAKALADAEAYAADAGWSVEWSPEESCNCAYDHNAPGIYCCDGSDCWVAVLRNEDGTVLASLGCICEPSDSYRRVVEAELASEAMHNDQACRRACAE